MPLLSATVGESYTITRIGGKVTVISVMGGNIIVNDKETRVAVSRELAMKIMI